MTEPTALAASPGALLRAAREKQGLHIAALAAAIMVAPRKLDALENDRWDELPDATFTRALAQTVCRTLKVDPRPILDKIPAAAPLALGQGGAGLNEPFRDRPGREDPGIVSGAVRPLVWGAALLMAAAVLVYVLPPDLWTWRPGGASPAAKAAPVAALPSPAPALPASAALAAAPVAAPAAEAAAAAAALSTDAPAVAAQPAPAGETVFSAPPAPEAQAGAAQPVAGAASGLVQLRTSEASWIEVRDARGATLLSRTVLPGESVGLDGKLPIRLTIGNASATQLGFRGQSVDLAPRTRDNVARVDLQ